MKSLFKYTFIFLLAAAPLVFAGGGLERPPGEPPFGVAVMGDAPGTKLNGVIQLEFYDIGTAIDNERFSAHLRILMRLTKGKKSAMFYAETTVVDWTSPSQVQDAIMAEMTQPVLDEFFNGNGRQIRVKSLEEFGRLGLPTVPTVLGDSHFILTNVQLAVR